MNSAIFLDLLGIALFAATGALSASRKELDIIGFLFLATITGIGGGTARDLILGVPVFWVEQPLYILICAVTAAGVFFTAHLLESRRRAIDWLDACALAVAVPAGVGVALSMGQPGTVVLIMGVATGCFGGLMRDVVCNEVPLVLRQGELYVTCAFAGALTALGAQATGFGMGTSLLACAAVTLGLRAGSLAFGWRLPVYKARPPRN